MQEMMRFIKNVDIMKLAVQIAGLFVAFALALFLPAGTLVWPAGWTFLVLFFGFTVAMSAWLLGHDPALLQERMKGTRQSGQKGWDRMVIRLTGIVFFAWLILMPLDAVRFHLSQVPVWLQVAGSFVLLCSFGLFFLTFRENPYLSPVVRAQAERGQTVITSGPYHYVRHPMYTGFLLFAIGTPLLLGSWLGLIGGSILVLMVAYRAVLEERMLLEELSGYAAYMTEVQYRLIPFIW
jgi:protein-S-isoprenylcysteine O-methyltransferase Ste14